MYIIEERRTEIKKRTTTMLDEMQQFIDEFIDELKVSDQLPHVLKYELTNTYFMTQIASIIIELESREDDLQLSKTKK